MKKIKKIIVLLLILYLIINAIYIFVHIDSGKSSGIVGMGFSSSKNMLRTFMGLPKTFSTYEGVSPVYMLRVAINLFLAIILYKYVYKKIT